MEFTLITYGPPPKVALTPLEDMPVIEPKKVIAAAEGALAPNFSTLLLASLKQVNTDYVAVLPAGSLVTGKLPQASEALFLYGRSSWDTGKVRVSTGLHPVTQNDMFVNPMRIVGGLVHMSALRPWVMRLLGTQDLNPTMIVYADCIRRGKAEHSSSLDVVIPGSIPEWEAQAPRVRQMIGSSIGF